MTGSKWAVTSASLHCLTGGAPRRVVVYAPAAGADRK